MARIDRELTPQDVLEGTSVKAGIGNPVTLPGGRQPLQSRIPGAHHPKINVEDFNWSTYPDNDEDGRFQTSMWKLSFRRKQDGVIQFYFISSPGSKRVSPNNTDILKAVKTYKSLPLEISAGLWWYQVESGDDWKKVDENFSNPLDYKNVNEQEYEAWMKMAGVYELDYIKGTKRPKTDEQIAFEKEKAKDDEIAKLRAEVEKLKSKNV